ncbi:MAG: hypothetical protein AAFR87_15690 [Bacteroidota bacterium]
MKNNLLISTLLIVTLLFGCKTTKPDRIVNAAPTTPPPAEVSPLNTRGQADQSQVQRRQKPVKKAPFSASIRERIDSTKNANISRIQYFISKDITLKRSTPINKLEIDENGMVIMADGKEETEILIPSDLKGTLQGHEKDQVMITFSVSDDRFLTFEKSEKDNGIYYLVAEWDEMGYGSIEYGGEKFTILPGGEGAQLMFSLERVSANKSARDIEKGRSVNPDGRN